MKRFFGSPFFYLLLAIFFIFPIHAAAAPYFYIEGDQQPVVGVNERYSVYLNTDGQTLTAVQTVISFNSSLWTPAYLGNLSSKCSFWSPADPSLGYGNTTTPYFYNSTKVVLACGFSNPGYSGTGLIARFTLSPTASQSGTFSFSNTQLRYIGTTITPGTSLNFDYTIYESTESAEAAPTPTPTSTPTPSSSGSTTSNATPTPTPDTLTSDDLTFVNVDGTSGTSGTSGSGSQTIITGSGATGDSALPLLEEDNTVPPPPDDLEQRAPATPFQVASSSADQDGGEVLSVQSLRELLIPGQSDADRTVVMVNMITTLTFLVLLAIVTWRLLSTSRSNKEKFKHISELVSSELSVLETKMQGAADLDDPSMVKDEIGKRLEELQDQMNS